MDQWTYVVLLGIPGTPQLGSELERAGREGFEAVGLTHSFNDQIAVLLKKRITEPARDREG